MKRVFAVVLAVLMLAGCGLENGELDRAMKLRAELLAAGCSFDAEITADYGDKIYTFSLTCQGNSAGDVTFEVTAPESIAGITGRVTDEGGFLTFDNAALAFPLLADEQISPVSGPWILLKTLRGGYVTACGAEGEGLRLSVDDSYEEDALHLDIWLDGNDLPTRAEILWDGRRIVTVAVENFRIS